VNDLRSAAALALPAGATNGAGIELGLAHLIDKYVRPGMTEWPSEVDTRLRALSQAADPDVRAMALATLHVARGDDPATRRFLTDAITRLGADDPVIRGRMRLVAGYLGDKLRGAGDPGGAIVAYSRALELAPNDTRVLVNLGLAQADAGDAAAAIKSYQRALALDPAQPLAFVNLGIAQQAAGDTASANASFRAALAIDPREPLAAFNLGNASMRAGDPVGAIAWYEKVIAIDASIAPAQFYLGDAYARTGQLAKALTAVRDGLQFAPGNAEARQAEARLVEAMRSRGLPTR
jgi:tetratricopeptide (TPR) repeat protein